MNALSALAVLHRLERALAEGDRNAALRVFAADARITGPDVRVPEGLTPSQVVEFVWPLRDAFSGFTDVTYSGEIEENGGLFADSTATAHIVHTKALRLSMPGRDAIVIPPTGRKLDYTTHHKLWINRQGKILRLWAQTTPTRLELIRMLQAR